MKVRWRLLLGVRLNFSVGMDRLNLKKVHPKRMLYIFVDRFI